MKAVLILVLTLLGCATVYVEPTVIRYQLSEKLKGVDVNAEQAENNYADETELMKDVNSMANDAARDEMKESYARMTSAIVNIRRLRKSLHGSRDAFVSLAGSRTRIKSNEPDYTQAQDIVHQFNQDMSFFNEAYSSYARVSNDLKEGITANKLNQWADADEIRAQLKKSVEKSTQTFFTIQKNVAAAQILAEQNGKKLEPAIYRLLSSERDSFKNRLERLQEIEHYFRIPMAKIHKISIADPNWQEFYDHAKEAEDIAREMKEISKRVQAELEKL